MISTRLLKIYLKDGKRLLTLHHFTNFLLSASFYLSKVISPICELLYRGKLQCHIESREHEIFIFLAFVIFWKNRKAATWVHYVANIFVYTKLANLILYYRIEPRVAIIYGIICIVQTVILPEPAYTGPEKVIFFRGPSLKEELQRDPKTIWIIEFYVAWSPECQQVAEVFAHLSEKYSLPNLKFGKLDVGRYTDEAERFRINTHPTSRQLPTFSLFKGGKEIGRRPLVNANGRAIRYTFREENVIMDFHLNDLYKECKETLSKKDKVALTQTDNHAKAE